MFCAACSSKQGVEQTVVVPKNAPSTSILVLKNTFTPTLSTDTMYAVDDTYFEMGLTSVTTASNKFYLAQRSIEKSAQPYRSVTLYMVKPDSSVLRFKESTHFLNYMDSVGYEMQTSKEHSNGWDYVFKKKSI